jgi:HEAT repeat protein
MRQPSSHRLLRPHLLLASALLFAAAGPALADRVHLRNGQVLEGELSEDGDEYVLRMRSGIETRLARADVLEVERAATPQQTLAARRAGLSQDDLEGHRRLARWCDAQGLDREAEELRRAMLGIAPDDVETRRLLGFVLHEGAWLTRPEYMEGLGLVQGDDGRTWITPEEAADEAARERAEALRPELERLMRRAARAPEEVVAGLARYDDLAAVPVLLDAMRHENLDVSQLALGELTRRAERVVAQGQPDGLYLAAPKLAQAAVEDGRRQVRSKALDVLAVIDHPEVPNFFARALMREHPFQRIYAAQAVGAFPSRRAVPALIYILRESASGFGRVSMSVEIQRAFIRDFELSSGGTGLVVAEVADPVVGVSREGTVLDVRVVQWERRAVLTSLRRVTGQSLGGNPGAWEGWWRRNQDTFQPR